MKFEYKRPSTTKNDAGRIIVSMTEIEAKDLLMSLGASTKKEKMAVHHMRRGLLDYFHLYKTVVTTSKRSCSNEP